MRFLHPMGRLKGFAVPLLSLRTRAGPCGEFPDILVLAEIAKSWNMNLIQLLPLNDTGTQTSPYSALSAFALNPIYLRIQDMDEVRGANAAAGKARARAKALSLAMAEGSRVHYEAILKEKMDILLELWQDASEGADGQMLRSEVDAWAKAHPWSRTYGAFMEQKMFHGNLPWWEWPIHKDVAEEEEFSSLGRFHLWIQMRAEEQFEAASRACLSRGVDILGDIPILMNVDSADVWTQRDLFDLSLSAGAPPDMYSSAGQNWGFPLYRWKVLEAQGYGFWKDRLSYAAKFYSAYRIDHVLGFFRIWAIGTREKDGYLGRFEPEYSISYHELSSLDFDPSRIRWLSLPHLPGEAVRKAFGGLPEEFAAMAADRLLARIGNEDLYLFAPHLRGSLDIVDTIYSSARTFFSQGKEPWDSLRNCEEILCSWWKNRVLLEIDQGLFVPTWDYSSAQGWSSLSEREKTALGALIARRKGESLGLWERNGREILKVLSESVDMQAFAEDLGVVPPCVPHVLNQLGIPGLRVLRWHRSWDEPGNPYVELHDYPENSMACTSVHDSSMLREWWEKEADREAVWALASRALGEGTFPAQAPSRLDPDSAALLLRAFARVGSRIVVFPLQDILAATQEYREEDPKAERINVPGTSLPSNWTYRMKPYLETLVEDSVFAAKAAAWFKADQE